MGIARATLLPGREQAAAIPGKGREVGEVVVERAIARITGKIITVCDVDRDLAIERN